MQEDKEITLGDIVKLKSGGPIMTVKEKSENQPDAGDNDWYCVWFDINTKLHHGNFKKETLKLIEDW